MANKCAACELDFRAEPIVYCDECFCELRAEVERLKDAILTFGNDNDFDWKVLGKIDELETEVERLTEADEVHQLNRTQMLASNSLYLDDIKRLTAELADARSPCWETEERHGVPNTGRWKDEPKT